MTRLAIMADIHGNLPALEAVIDDMAQYAVDHVVVAGDSVNCGPFSREVLEVIHERNWALIRGNNEYYATEYKTPRMPAHWSRFTLPPLLLEQLGADWLRRIACLPDALSLRFPDAQPLAVFHGLPGNPWRSITPLSTVEEVKQFLDDLSENTIICAHSHIPMERHIERWHILNPGSVGIPLDGERSASYMIIDGDHAGWRLSAHRRVPFSNEANFAAFEVQRFAERGGITAVLLMQEFQFARMRLWPYLQWKRRHHADQPDSVALLDEFERLEDSRPYMPPEYRDLSAALYRD
ncbi:MAG: metallophosphoesterase family protein [Chloroflexi bacterium]|nr:metallophosphoesterase family protein [Chloroflexota bacterium]